jgi:phosphatidate cytidylyltransferase
MLAQRLITAALGLPIIVAVTLIGGLLFTLVVAAALAVAALEYFAATDPEFAEAAASHPNIRRVPPSLVDQRRIAWAGAAAVALMALAAASGLDYLAGTLAAALAGVFLLLIVQSEPREGLRDWTWALAGLVYVGFLGAHLVLVRDFPKGEHWLLLALLATFATDSASYVAGKAAGRTYVIPRISPGKTLEGYIGGYVGGFLAVFLLEWLLDADMTFAETFLLAWVFPPVAMLGDLAESMIKRGGGVKDASELVPGHGGFLDRLDSILFTAPLVYYFALWVVF